jgi:hypothetical protein
MYKKTSEGELLLLFGAYICNCYKTVRAAFCAIVFIAKYFFKRTLPNMPKNLANDSIVSNSAASVVIQKIDLNSEPPSR